jgi:hypothetical protein
VHEAPVRVEVERSGGFAGIVTRRSADTADLPPEAAAELRGLVAGVDLSGLEQRLAATTDAPGPPAGGADRFQYDVTVDDGQQVHRFSVQDGSVPPELQPLLGAAMRLGRPA